MCKIKKNLVKSSSFVDRDIDRNRLTEKNGHSEKLDRLGWYGFFIEWHIHLLGLFNAKAILVEKHQWYLRLGGLEGSYLSQRY